MLSIILWISVVHSELKNAAVLRGTSVRLECQMQSTSNKVAKWTFCAPGSTNNILVDENRFSSNETSDGQLRSILFINKTRLEDAGTYSCISLAGQSNAELIILGKYSSRA